MWFVGKFRVMQRKVTQFFPLPAPAERKYYKLKLNWAKNVHFLDKMFEFGQIFIIFAIIFQHNADGFA